MISEGLNPKFFWEGMPPDPLSSFVRYSNTDKNFSTPGPLLLGLDPSLLKLLYLEL